MPFKVISSALEFKCNVGHEQRHIVYKHVNGKCPVTVKFSDHFVIPVD